MLASAGYDRTVRVWDPRAADATIAVHARVIAMTANRSELILGAGRRRRGAQDPSIAPSWREVEDEQLFSLAAASIGLTYDIAGERAPRRPARTSSRLFLPNARSRVSG